MIQINARREFPVGQQAKPFATKDRGDSSVRRRDIARAKKKPPEGGSREQQHSLLFLLPNRRHCGGKRLALL
ncbi:MAG TPA: hypothetical protein VFJ62_03930 [Usitatibacter sp.]|nr:hypothetical protein [Usitatibacter sp.]